MDHTTSAVGARPIAHISVPHHHQRKALPVTADTAGRRTSLTAATDPIATELARHLVSGYVALSCAAIEAEQLVKLNSHYRGAAGCDLQTAILDAATAVENAVCAHDLAKFHPFWTHPRDTTETDHTRAALSESAHVTAARLRRAGRAPGEYPRWLGAKQRYPCATDHHYGNHAGYVGGLGWDLETAIDDAVIAIRDHARRPAHPHQPGLLEGQTMNAQNAVNARPPAATADRGNLLEAALAYACADLAVFPLRPRSKAPLISNDDGGRGFHDATTDPAQIRQWWTNAPNANIGIRPPPG